MRFAQGAFRTLGCYLQQWLQHVWHPRPVQCAVWQMQWESAQNHPVWENKVQRVFNIAPL